MCWWSCFRRLHSAAHDPAAVRPLADAIAYVEGRVFKKDIEDRYNLSGYRSRNPFDAKFVGNIGAIALDWACSQLADLVSAQPDAAGSELLMQLTRLKNDTGFADAAEDRPGRFRILRGRAETAAWLRDILLHRLDVEDLDDSIHRLVTSPEALALLTDDPDGEIVLQAMELRRRKSGLGELRAVIDDATSSETLIQPALQRESWIFGGQYVGISEHRRLVSGDELDIPLLRPDDTLCVVELKLAQVPVVKRHRGSWVANRHVGDAVSQAVNYLCGLDEARDRVLAQYGIDSRRANAVVLVGHPAAQPDATEAEVDETLRLYNSHHARVEVRTYKHLLDDAENALKLGVA
ncbi:Shedu anti-phage system protein SduA domain-containing protein [Phytomonospora endophytica]|uniref:Shedu protein SduA C-terminal domain-containing protein n=1 Tax=Phytomonospora endophytica TaxID=714109 RepID=A0A841FS54_9ACTN|nr:Shedu anti-phage system protein SduA domain-containing protein [Phytomonospora endophytica]MBB6036382.1 hypothetical protein [Phytomonospora endophytica]GIG65703.1 hypothetical protein Pen01_19980 [Phytomonospora endophytica]